MLKSQDIVILLKLLAHAEHLTWPQNKLALHLCISSSELNMGLKRLRQSGLLSLNVDGNAKSKLAMTVAHKLLPVWSSCEEVLVSGVKYFFPVQLGEYTRGIVTSYAAPIFIGSIIVGGDHLPVWPFAEGKQRGLALKPLYPSVPKSITEYPDQEFYDLLVLVDAIRQGRIREGEVAVKLLREKLRRAKKQQ
ncbi:MAG: hypothetical protein KAS93_01915 [Gammaproteobacteria bacterium]|nr:hypothetical protein [Gammaproteobacteria bacterium]